jgi:hypothetical protein
MRKPGAIFLSSFLFMNIFSVRAQTLGGNTVYNFLNLPNTPQLNALGGINISTIGNDAGMAFNAPALLRQQMNTQLDLAFNTLPGGVNDYGLNYAFFSPKWQTVFAAGVHFFDYGNLAQTDASGNSTGSFHPTDYVLQLTASRQYEKRWFYGGALKFIQSSYGIYRSSGIALDVMASYFDSTRLLQAGILLKNMGTQITKYQGSAAGDLPFDLELGITKRLNKAPVQFSFTMHHVHQFNLLYNDSVFNSANDLNIADEKGFTADKLFRHFIFAVQVFPSSMVEITVSYNYLRRKELRLENGVNGLTGFSLGFGVLLKKWQFRYTRGYYQQNLAYNQFGLQLTMKEFMGMLKSTR